jgi:cobalamin transport system substrate-binding protein
VPLPSVTTMLRCSACAVALMSATAAVVYAQTQAPAPPEAPAASAPESAPAFREVTDELGRTIRVPQTIHRIVSLAPNLTETLYALGLQDRLVGDTEYCDFPEDARHKPKVGGVINPSIEAIVALHPDLVLVTKMSNRLETVNSLANVGIPSYTTDPHTMKEIISSIQHLADLLGYPEAGNTQSQDLERRLADLQRRVSPFPRRKVLFVIWTQPLISIGKDTFIADALRYAGADSIVDSPQSWPQVNLEEVARAQPDFLVFAGSHTETMPVRIEGLSELPGWRILDAVRNHRYVKTSEGVERPAPRILSAIEDLARQFHPEAFLENPDTGRPEAGQKPPEHTDEISNPHLLSAHPNQCHPESPRLLRGEGSAFSSRTASPSPAAFPFLEPPNVLSSVVASQRQCLLEVLECAR